MGPLARSWEPRLGLAGTFDDAWRASRWPDLPLDFDFAHYNSAHPDLIAEVPLRGDEEIALEGVHPEGDLKLSLPAYRMALLFRLKDGALAPAPLFLDTLLVDVPKGRVHLTWRATFNKRHPIRVIEARMQQPNGA
jgi:hypothetical protein